uniref:Uncharacterized protein n=1 Tax=Ascaris lumbricoides TaxID=6252 RepID=A0A0M3I8U5_ASCLU
MHCDSSKKPPHSCPSAKTNDSSFYRGPISTVNVSLNSFASLKLTNFCTPWSWPEKEQLQFRRAFGKMNKRFESSHQCPLLRTRRLVQFIFQNWTLKLSTVGCKTGPYFGTGINRLLILSASQRSKSSCTSKAARQGVQQLSKRADIDRERELELFHKSQTDEFLHTPELARERAVTISSNIQQNEQTLRELSSVPSLTNPPPTNAAASTVHLPKMDLKTFDGGLQDWPAFWDWYKSAIDSQRVPEVQKLMYLKSCLTGSAATLKGAYALRTHAYTTVVDALKKRYKHPEAILNTLCDELDDLPRAREGQLAKLTENIDSILELLAHQGEPTNTRPIQRVIQRKLPKGVLEKLEQAKAVTRE